MSNYQHILLPFKLHDHRFQPHHHIAVRFAPPIPVVELVVIPIRKVIWVCLLSPPHVFHQTMHLWELKSI